MPAERSTRPLACGERANTWVIPSSPSARANWVDGRVLIALDLDQLIGLRLGHRGGVVVVSPDGGC